MANLDKIISLYWTDHQNVLTYPWLLYLLIGITIIPVGTHVTFPLFIHREEGYGCVCRDDIVGSLVENSSTLEILEPICGTINNSTQVSLNFTIPKNESIISEFQLICENSIYNTITKIGFFFGFLLGAILGGYISDNLGRKNAILIGSIFMVLTDISASYSTNIFTYGLSKCINGLAANTNYIGSFVLLMETANQKYRAFIGCTAASTFCCFGIGISSIWAYVWPEWRDFQFWLLLSVLPNFLILFEVKESCRWLYSKGRYFEMGESVLFILKRSGGRGKVNEERLYEEMEIFNAEEEEEKKSLNYPETKNNTQSILSVFKHGPKMTKISLIIMYIWFVASVLFYGSILSGSKLPMSYKLGNLIMNLLNAAFGPGLAFIGIDLKCSGRKKTVGYATIFACSLWILQTLLREYGWLTESTQNTIILILETIIRIFITVSFASLYTFTGELFPTPIRANAIGIGSLASRIGGMSVPVILQLDIYFSWLPSIVCSFLGLVSGGLALLLPETRGMELLVNFDEAREFYDSRW